MVEQDVDEGGAGGGVDDADAVVPAAGRGGGARVEVVPADGDRSARLERGLGDGETGDAEIRIGSKCRRLCDGGGVVGLGGAVGVVFEEGIADVCGDADRQIAGA